MTDIKESLTERVVRASRPHKKKVMFRDYKYLPRLPLLEERFAVNKHAPARFVETFTYLGPDGVASTVQHVRRYARF